MITSQFKNRKQDYRRMGGRNTNSSLTANSDRGGRYATHQDESISSGSTSNWPLVSIITLNYNKANVTRDLLISLKSISYPSVEIIVVDNASVDKSFLPLKNEFPHIQLIPSPINLGFAGGNNLGMKAARGDLFLMINNDVEVVEDFLEPMVSLFKEDERTGMVSPKIIYYGRGERIQYAGSRGINPWTGRGKKDGQLEVDHGQYDFVRETELVHGACMMVSRKLVEEVGAFDESFFIYYEEHDWAVRAKQKGFKLFYTGESKIYHKESMTTGKESPFKTYYMAKNRILFLRRNVPYPARLFSLLVFFFAAVPKKIVKNLMEADFKNISALVRGILWHLRV